MAEDVIRPGGPGRFSTMVNQYVYELSQEGLTDEMMCSDGSWLGLLAAMADTPLYDEGFKAETQLNEAEKRFLKPKAGVIIEEHPDGRFTMDYFERTEDLQVAWENLKPRADVASEEDFEDEPAPPPVQVTDEILTRAENEGYEDGKSGATKASTPSMARFEAWMSAGGYRIDANSEELGLIVDAWRRGLYRSLEERNNTSPA